MGRFTWVRLQQPQEQRYPVLQVHAGSFRVSVIHRTLTCTTGSLTCARDHSYACYTHGGLGTPTANQHNNFAVLCSWADGRLNWSTEPHRTLKIQRSQVRTPVMSTRNQVMRVFPESKNVLTRCRCALFSQISVDLRLVC